MSLLIVGLSDVFHSRFNMGLPHVSDERNADGFQVRDESMGHAFDTGDLWNGVASGGYNEINGLGDESIGQEFDIGDMWNGMTSGGYNETNGLGDESMG
jgi:hypothetical protein